MTSDDLRCGFPMLSAHWAFMHAMRHAVRISNVADARHKRCVFYLVFAWGDDVGLGVGLPTDWAAA